MNLISKLNYGLIGLLALCCLFTGQLMAQDLSKPIPFDPKVKIGKLDNGIRYFIRKNAKPEKKVELRLVINAGSMQEDEDQLGLAHFTEHMCFNGSKNFEKNEIVDYLQSVGVKFGADLNAYTSFDETVYMLPIPSDDSEIMDKGFQILEDWAHNVSFEGEEIDKERGVVIEEWRTGRGANQRMRDKYFPIMLKGSRYAERLPIGKKNILEGFEYETIKRFYRDWYRPDLMSVIVVGDIDPAEMEAKIKKYFGNIKPVENPRKREKYGVPRHDETLIAIASDKEAAFTQVQLYYKHDKKPMKTLGDMRQSIVRRLYNGMLNQRMEELSQKPQPPFIFGSSSYSGFLGDKDAYSSFAQVSEDAILPALETLLIENKRVLKHGFNATELERYKKELLKFYEEAYNERNKTASRRYTFEYISYVTDDSPSPGIEFEYDFMKKVLPTITIEEVNKLPQQWITDKNRVVIITGPKKAGVTMPTEAEVKAVLAKADKMKVEAYEDKVIDEPLMAEMPTPGSVSKEKVIKQVDATEITLSNGIKVVVKTTDFKDDEVLMRAFSLGGHSLVSDADYHSATNAASIVSESGLRKFSSTDMQKLMAGKNVNVSPYIGELSEGFFGSGSPKDLETMLQMTHLYFMSPREDEDAFQSYINKNKALYKNLLSNPQFYFFSKVSEVMTQNNPRGGGFPRAEDLEKVKLDQVMKVYKDRFANAGDFTFFFVGNVDKEELKPMLEKYLGSLPNTNREETWKDLGVRPPKGVVEKSFLKGTDPKSQVMISFTGEMEEADAYNIKSLAEALSIKLIENLREEKGGVYSTRATSSTSKFPYPNYTVNVSFSCAPENVETLVNAVYEEVKKVQANGPTPEDLSKVKEAQKRDVDKNFKQNRYWLNTLQSAYYQGNNLKKMTKKNMLKRIDKLSAKDIQEAAKKYCDMNNRIALVMKPEPKPEGEDTPENSAAAVSDEMLKKMTVKQVMDKYIAAIGGRETLEKVKSIKMTGKMEMMGMQIEVTSIKVLPNKFIQIQKMPMGETKIIFNGEKGAMITPQGKQEIPEAAAETMKDQAIIFPELNYEAQGITAKIVKVEAVEGKNAVQVDFTDKAGQTSSKWYDLESGLLVKNAEQGQERIFMDYKEVDGVKVPTKAKVKVQGMDAEVTTDFEVNPQIDESLFKVE